MKGCTVLGLRKASWRGKGEKNSLNPKTMQSVKLCFIVYSTRRAHSPNFICRIFSRSSEPFSPSLNMSHIVTSRYNSHSSNSNPLYIYALFFSPTFGGMLRCVLLQSTEYVKTVLQSMHGIHYFVLNVGG